MAQWKVHVFAIQAALRRAVCCCVALGKCLSVSSASPLLKGDGSQAWDSCSCGWRGGRGCLEMSRRSPGCHSQVTNMDRSQGMLINIPQDAQPSQ